jgi:hypothetical protein
MSQNDFDLARFNYENYRYCYDNGHQQFLVKALRCFEFWRGNQWTDADVRRLNAAGRPALTINTIESLVRALRGMQMALRNDVRFAPTQSVDTNGAQVRDALWLDTQARNKLNFLESDNYLRGIIMSRAFYDVRVDFSESMQGNVSIREKRPQDVVLDPMFLSYDPADWPQVYDHCWENLLDLEYLYGKDKAEAIKGSQDPSFFDIDDIAQSREFGQLPYYYAGWAETEIDSKLVRAFKVISRQYSVLKRKDCFVDTVTGDFSEIPESFSRERIQKILRLHPDVTTLRRDVKTVRWTVTCNDVVLHDDDSPYRWFTIVPYFPTMLDGTCLGLVESLIDPQQLYNKVTSQELHIINTTANSGWKTVKGNIKNYTTEQLERGGAATGIVLELENIENTQKIEPNQVPQGHERISFKADQVMRQLGGVSKSGMGFAREDVSGDAIEQNQAAQDLNSVGWLENLYRSRQLLAERSQDCWQAYYTESRVVTINRGSAYKPDYQQVGINQVTDEGEVVNDITQGRYTTMLVPAPTRTTMSESDFKLLAKLRADGVLNIPDDMLIEMLPVSNKTQLMQRIKGDSNDDQAQQKQVELQNAIKQGQVLDSQIAKTNADADLSTARANKANAEAADPAAADAAYERVEMARISSDHALETARLSQQGTADALKHRQATRKDAIALTKIESENANHRQKMMVDLAKTAAKPPPAPKAPAAKKPAGKKTQTRKRA